MHAPQTLIIGCGAIANEILAVTRANGLNNFRLTCLPASWHNTPQKIVPAVLEKIAEHRDDYARIFVAYGDCGTGGELDRALQGTGVERIGGPHCYSFFAGSAVFDDLMEAELGTFFLTDYLARHFDRLIIEGMGLDRFPQLHDQYFGHYKKLIYLAQEPTEELRAHARAAASRLGLAYEEITTGYGELTGFMRAAVTSAAVNSSEDQR